MSKLDKEQMKMVEVQADMMDLFVKYADNMDEAIAIAFKTVLDCYVAQFGREGAESMLITAIESIKEGKHDLDPANIPQNLLN